MQDWHKKGVGFTLDMWPSRWKTYTHLILTKLENFWK